MTSTAADTPRRPRRADAGELRDDWPVGQSVTGVVRTALCVEPRDGRLHVFLPPQRLLEDYLDLVAAVEATARELGPAGDDRGLPAAARSTGSTISASRPTPA